MRYFLVILALFLVGCPSATPLPQTAPSIAVSTQASDWSLLYGIGLPAHPAPVGTGWQFTIPTNSGAVHYVTVPYTPAVPILGKTVTMTFEVHSATPGYNALIEPGEVGPPSLHLFLQRAGDNFTGQGQYQYYRWWCEASQYLLGSRDNQIITVSCPLVSASWTSVYGKTDPTDFAAALQNLQSVGLTFGGSDGWGHGVNLTSGTAQFQMLNYAIR